MMNDRLIRIFLRRGLAALALALAASLPAVAEEGPLGFETSSLSGNYLAGRYAGKLGDMDVAAEYFSQALRDDPSNQHLIERTFVLAISSGDIAQAEEMAALVLGLRLQEPACPDRDRPQGVPQQAL